VTQSPAQARRQREKDERRHAILAAAREVFFEEGIGRATVDDVAARAAVSKGTVYLYFESKETILAHLLLEGLAILLDKLERAYQPERSLPAPRRLRSLARAYLEFFQEYPDYFRLLIAFDRGQLAQGVAPEVSRQVLADSLHGFNFVVQAVEQGVADGDFVTRHPRRSAAVLWAGLNGAVVLLSHPLRRTMVGAELPSLYRETLQTFLNGISRGDSPRARDDEGAR
jgi:AcrR family transcriptional regulator